MKLEFVKKDQWIERVNTYFTIGYTRYHSMHQAPYFLAVATITIHNGGGTLYVKSIVGAPTIMGAKRNLNIEISNLLLPEDKQ